MTNLTTKTETINSREIAEMMSERHDSVIRKIETISDNLGKHNFVLSEYFIETTYKAGTREYKCYEITRKGCEMIAHKTTGEKGIIFTAKYIEKFHSMEQQISGQAKIQTKEITVEEELRLNNMMWDILKVNDNSKLLLGKKFFETKQLPTTALPTYTDSKGTLLSGTELLKRNNIEMSIRALNKLLLEKGIIVEKTRNSNKGEKKFKSLVGIEYGENQVSPHNPKQTQILFYEDKFMELINSIV
ncbi:MAG: Rha family transcriptional regulator [Clostridium sp.]|uniref:Rha family transcriptional regulator n=1 Tax=Clostridium sp. TaxID=1506 RepID=UPI003F3E1C27